MDVEKIYIFFRYLSKSGKDNGLIKYQSFFKILDLDENILT
jgi:hypothetical protein